jgi:hypothetical protein
MSLDDLKKLLITKTQATKPSQVTNNSTKIKYKPPAFSVSGGKARITMNPETEKTPYETAHEQNILTKDQEEIEKLRKEREKESKGGPTTVKFAEEASIDVKRLKLQLANLAGQRKEMMDWEKKNSPAILNMLPRGSGLSNAIAGMAGTNPNVKPFEGSKQFMTTTIAKIISPSSRPGPDMMKMIGEALPDLWSTNAESKIHFVNALYEATASDAARNPKNYPDINYDDPTSMENFRAKTKANLENLYDAVAGVSKINTSQPIAKQQTSYKQTATNPATGEKLGQLESGEWVPIK